MVSGFVLPIIAIQTSAANMSAPLIRVTFLLFFGMNTRFGNAVRVDDIPRYRFVKIQCL